jgi:hypothetical protein
LRRPYRQLVSKPGKHGEDVRLKAALHERMLFLGVAGRRLRDKAICSAP